MASPEVKLAISLAGIPVGIATLVQDPDGNVRIEKAVFSAHPANLKMLYADFASRLPETGQEGTDGSDG